jgi:KaiC/GvpD/RAD55 family RecA-like ATPase
VAIPKVEPYQFDVSLVRALTLFACSSQSFWGRLGSVLDPEAMPEGAPRYALSAAREIASEQGNGPVSDRQVIQRLISWKNLGRMTQEQIRLVTSFFEDAQDDVDAGLWTHESAVTEATKILKPRLQQQALMRGMAEWSARGDLAPVAEDILQASRVGDADLSYGTVWGADAVVSALNTNALPTGISLLDDALGGGIRRKELCVVCGGTGDGKSQFLIQVAIECALKRQVAAYITLEVSTEVIGRRFAANLTGIPYDMIKSGAMLEEAKDLLRKKTIPMPTIKEFSSGVTTVGDIRTWLKNTEVHMRRPFDLLVVDMADHLCAPKEKGDYTGYKIVYNDLRNLAREQNKWLWTATHSTRKKDKQKRIDVDHVSDSMHKARLADTLVTLSFDDDTRDIEIYLAKGRDIEGKKLVGTIPTDFATSMIVRVARPAEIGTGTELDPRRKG